MIPRPLAHETAGAGRALVAIHGNFASRAWWARLLERPPAGWRVVAPDLPGYGDSAALGGELGVPDLADALEGLAASLELDRPVIAGHSLGGAVALELAARDPARYRGLVLVASPPPSGFPHDGRDGVRRLLHRDRSLTRQSFVLQSPGLDDAGRTEAGLERFLDEAARMHPASFNAAARSLGTWSVLGRAPALAALPTLAVAGGLDPIVTPRLTERLAGELPCARVHLEPEAGHWPQLERPDSFERELARFLEALP